MPVSRLKVISSFLEKLEGSGVRGGQEEVKKLGNRPLAERKDYDGSGLHPADHCRHN